MLTAIMTSFQPATPCELSPTNMKTTCTTVSRTSEESVMALGAMVVGKKAMRRSARGDQKCL